MQKQDLKGSKILLPCAADARHVLTQGLKDSGADVERIHIYTALPPESADQGTIDEVKNADIITFTSSSTAKNFFSIIESTDAELASIGPVTSETLRGLGHTPHIEAEEFTVEGLVESIIARCSKGTN
jgi:uroporphyrinogen III methyltransferase/synthase